VSVLPVLGIDGGGLLLAGLALLVLAVLVVRSSVEVVMAHEKRALLVRGEYRGMLDPGLNFVPPLVSATHSVDRRTQEVTLPVEARSRDGERVVVDCHLEHRVTDPETAFLRTHEDDRRLGERVRSALQEAVAGHRAADLYDDPEVLDDALARSLSNPDDWGVTVDEARVEGVRAAAEAPNGPSADGPAR